MTASTSQSEERGQLETVTLSESVISALREHVQDAKASGWASEDLRTYFAMRGVLLADYTAAINKLPISPAIADTLAGVSVYGITGFPTSRSYVLDVQSVAALRKHLVKSGFQPVAVRTGDKVPTATGWQHIQGDIPAEIGTLNTGINTRGLRAVDIDIDDPERAETAMRLLREFTGQAPLLKRTRKGSSRVMTLWRAPEGSEPGKEQIVLPFKNSEAKDEKVEILGSGQMFVAFGRHPSGEFLEWGVRSPLNTLLTEIPILTAGQERAFLDAACNEFGGRAPGQARSDASGGGNAGSSRAEYDRKPRNPFGFEKDANPFWAAVNDRAMASLGSWVPALFPSAVFQASTQGYRVTSASLGRNLEEDLSITPQGIVDWGTHDLGHPREGSDVAP